MGRSVICEAYLEEYLKSLAKRQGTSVGLLIGQPSKNGKDYVVHLNKIKDDCGADQGKNGLLDIESKQVSHHALVETRVLPGGFYVMGIFVINPKSVFEDPVLVGKVKTILVDIRHTFASNGLLHGNCDELDGGDKLVFFYSSSSNVFGCKSISPKSDGLKPCDWKFQDRATSWHVMSTFYETDDVFALRKKGSEQYETEDNLTECVEVVKKQLEQSLVFFDGEPVDAKELIESVLKAKKDDPFVVHIYAPSSSTTDITTCKLQTFSGTLKFDGVISSKCFVHPKTSFAEAKSFIKADIVRSLMSRIQIHCDSLVQAEDSIPDTIMLNELPRRIYFPIRAKSNQILFSEYLFREEGKETAIPQIQETLDLSFTPKELNATVEIVAEVKEEERHDAKECGPTDGAGGKKKKEVERPSTVLLGAVGAIAVLIVAILVFLLTK
uniref:Putative olfactory receptor 4-like protein n=1 Tax=Culex tarsalis TaxID=7177 RepID=A0A1Q3F9Z2_CULTA